MAVATHWTNREPQSLVGGDVAKFDRGLGWVIKVGNEQVILNEVPARSVVDVEIVRPLVNCVSYSYDPDVDALVPATDLNLDHVALGHTAEFVIGNHRYIYYAMENLEGVSAALQDAYPLGMFVCISDSHTNSHDLFAQHLYTNVYLPSLNIEV